MSEWHAAKYESSHGTVFVLSGGEASTNDEVVKRISRILGCKMPSVVKTIGYNTPGRNYYVVKDALSSVHIKKTIRAIADKSAESDFYKHDDITGDADNVNDCVGFGRLVRLIRMSQIGRSLLNVGGLTVTAMLAFLTIKLFRYGFLNAAILSLALGLTIPTVIVLGVIGCVPGAYIFGKGLFLSIKNIKSCIKTLKKGSNDFRIIKYPCDDKVLYVVYHDWECGKRMIKSINRIVNRSKELSTIHLEAHLSADGYLYFTRDYMDNETRPEDVRYGFEEVANRFDTCNGHCYELRDEKKTRPEDKSEAVSAALLSSMAGSSDKNSMTRDKAEQLCRDIQHIEAECLGSTTISNRVQDKLSTLERLDDDAALPAFIEQLKDIKSSLGELKDNDTDIDAALSDVSSIIEMKSQLKSR